MAALMAPGMIAALLAPEPPLDRTAPPEHSGVAATIAAPICELIGRLGPLAIPVLRMVAGFRMPGYVSSAMAVPLFKALHYSNTDIATVTKLFGFGAGTGKRRCSRRFRRWRDWAGLAGQGVLVSVDGPVQRLSGIDLMWAAVPAAIGRRPAVHATPRAIRCAAPSRHPWATPGIEEPTLSRIKFDPEAIRALATILSDTDLTEIEIVEADSRIRVARAAPAVVAPVTYAAPPLAVAAPAAAPAPAAPAPSSAGTVASPMVGIAYLSAEPGAPAYVTVGQTVTAGQTVMLIEAMKTFNQIKAPRAGAVTSILVTSGQPVEYDQALMVIE